MPRSRFHILLPTCFFAFFFCTHTAMAGGPLVAGSNTFGVDGQPFTWDVSAGPVQYRTDGGPLSSRNGVVVVSNAAAIARVQSLFQVWQDVPSANISYTRAGSLLPVAGFTDGDVSTVKELDAVKGSCDAGTQSPIIFDADGSIFTALIGDPGVIGFSGPCKVDSNGHIVTAWSVMNGIFQDGIDSGNNYELPAAVYDEAFTHEFGHFSGLGHSQINLDVFESVLFSDGAGCSTDSRAGLPIMFPILICPARSTTGLPRLSQDDIAWISNLYPNANFTTNYGTIRGKILFSDGITGAQGVNVIARRADDPNTTVNESRSFAVSSVSGYLFTDNPGQSVTGTNTGGSEFGSRDPALVGFYEIPVPAGSYVVEVESINPGFTGGSSVGPLDPSIPNPGFNEFWDSAESETDNPADFTPIDVVPGAVLDRDIILNGTDTRFDNFEDGGPGGMALLRIPRRPDRSWASLRPLPSAVEIVSGGVL